MTVRELLALSAPWYWGVVPPDAPPGEVAAYAAAWAQLRDPGGFAARWGPRTAERRHPCYNYTARTTRHECNWDGPSWPYETSRLLTGLGHLLSDYPPAAAAAGGVGPADFLAGLAAYARAHTQSTAINGTRPWVGEDLHPDDGFWVARSIMYAQNASDRNRGEDYNHSSFVDVVIAGLVGLRAALGGLLRVNPLVPPGGLAYFAVDNARVHGRDVTVLWDADGSRYGRGAGLGVWCGGARVAGAPALGVAVEVDLATVCPWEGAREQSR